ncbi:MAG: hypothetical protein B7Y39_00605 [Bdellovibrio sp. 28-41-41]|nr:MAG: hypothetical protein B7Y39_00605 [Bdellovibrio sp. 28-41-41]
MQLQGLNRSSLGHCWPSKSHQYTNPVTVTAYSLFIVGSTALVGEIFYLKKGEVDLKTGFIFAVPSFFGST